MDGLKGAHDVVEMKLPRLAARMSVLLCLVWARSACADDALDQNWSLHAQYTGTLQAHPAFAAALGGPNSLSTAASSKGTNDVTLYLGVRPFAGAEIFVNPEVDQGFGLANTVGMAGFPSAEAYKVGQTSPYLKIPRLFYRQTFDLGGAKVVQSEAANQFAMNKAADELVLTIGKFSVVDIFDTNAYAHDGRCDFLNWSMVDAGAFDYAADSWGYTYGAAAELTQGDWTFRAGFFALSKVPNGEVLDDTFRQNEWVLEVERRYALAAHPGRLKCLFFLNRADMGAYADAVAASGGGIPSTALVRRYGSKSGWALNLQQELGADVGVFARASVNDGAKETYDFTDIDASFAGGLSLGGGWWSRPEDKAGIGFVVNRLSASARQYFAAGGLGPLIGDGPHGAYAAEQVMECYYSWGWAKSWHLTVDYQRGWNPAYDPQRGPIDLYALRMHADF